MNRLLQGDVGSGKTIVAIIAMLTAMENQSQAALMVPTEILAEQHARNIKKILAASPYRIELLTGSLKSADKKRLREAIADHARERRGGGVHPHERRADDTELHVGQAHLRLQQRKDRIDRLPVRVVEEADQPQQGDSGPFVHGAVSYPGSFTSPMRLDEVISLLTTSRSLT